MSSIAAIDRRCFVAPPAAPTPPRPPQEDRSPHWSASFVMTWRPPLERAKARR
jgi:hypothetical protein